MYGIDIKYTIPLFKPFAVSNPWSFSIIALNIEHWAEVSIEDRTRINNMSIILFINKHSKVKSLSRL